MVLIGSLLCILQQRLRKVFQIWSNFNLELTSLCEIAAHEQNPKVLENQELTDEHLWSPILRSPTSLHRKSSAPSIVPPEPDARVRELRHLHPSMLDPRPAEDVRCSVARASHICDKASEERFVDRNRKAVIENMKSAEAKRT
jgi:hypothetical protein